MLSIVIVNWNTRDDLRRCLSSIKSSPPKYPWEAIVVDNASQDGSAAMVSGEFPWAVLVSQESNLGYAKATNLALSRATGDVLLLNPDTEFIDGTLSRLPSWEGKVGARAGKLIDAKDGTTQRSIRSFPTPFNVLFDFFGFGPYRCRDFDYTQPAKVEQPMATFLLLRKEALDEVGNLDEQFPIFFNDVDLLRKLDEKGWETWYDPSLQVKHVGGAGTKQVRKSMIWESHRSLIRYWLKWHFRWWNAFFMVLLFGLVYGAALVRARGWDAGFRP